MAATGYTPIYLYYSSTAAAAPSAGNLGYGELALNITDKNLFFKDNTNTVNTVPIRQSSASSNGWLSSTDWSTFNSKQPAGSYALTTGTLAQFASTTSAQLAGVISDETGSGSLVFGTAPTITTPTVSSGNLIFSGTAQRITGDFSSTTNNGSDRLSLQSSTANGNSIINVIPNGTATGSQIRLFGNSDLTNASMGQLILTGATEFRIAAQITTGSAGTYVPINFYTNNAKQFEILTTGDVKVTTANLGLGVSPSSWRTTGQAVQNSAGALWNYSTTYQFLGQNYYYNSSGDRIYSTTAAATEYAQNGGTHSWWTAPSGTAGNPITFTKKFEVADTGDVTVSTGNLVIGTSGKGIDFSATAGTGTSELLADYEEGTWTPSLGGNTTYSALSATYTKVGRIVTIKATILVNAIGTGSTSTISGLPYTATAGINGCSVGYFLVSATNVVSLNPYIPASGSTIVMTGLTAAAAGVTAPLTFFKDGTYLEISATYQAA